MNVHVIEVKNTCLKKEYDPFFCLKSTTKKMKETKRRQHTEYKTCHVRLFVIYVTPDEFLMFA